MVAWIGGAVIAFSVTLTSLALQGAPRLSGQRLDGTRRVCLYGSGPQLKARRIGSGEPCPQTYRTREPEVAFIPSSAIRVAEGRSNGQTLCTYRFGQRDYRTLLPALIRCPLTPSGTMRVERDATADERGQ